MAYTRFNLDRSTPSLWRVNGLQQRSDVELRLGEYVGQFAETATPLRAEAQRRSA
jgi:hypothetical protein